ncbi:MAG: DUF305 domain-containing protein [Acidimicrobiales bacterium]
MERPLKGSSMKRLSSLVFVTLTGVAAIGLTACGSNSDEASSGSSADPAASAIEGASVFNDADVTFAQSMIPHHEQAVEMAEMALDPQMKASAEVTTIAKRVQAAQDPEITQMKQWLSAWGKPLQMDTTGGHDMSTMQGMMSSEDMMALGAANGANFDTMWLEMMVRHHEGAIAMAKTLKAEGDSPEAAKLADAVIAGQQAEIDEMQQLLDK